MSKEKGNMTEGNPGKLILTFSLPMIASNIVQQLYSMADSAIVGRFVGKDALAAIGATGSVLMLIICIIIGMTMGTCICTSQAYGAGDREQVKNIAGTAIFTSVGLSLFIAVLSLIVTVPVLKLLNTPEDIIPMARTYLLINTCTSIAPIVYNLEGNLMRALGDSRSPMYAVICASILNVGLDLLFVCVFGWGVAGAGAATAIAQFGSAIVCFIRIVKVHEILHLKKENIKFRTDIFKHIVSIGIPMSVQNAAASIGSMGIQRFVNGFGTDCMAAYTAAAKIDNFALMPLNSLGLAFSTFVGQNYGAGKQDRIKQGLRAAFLQAILWGVGLMIVINLFGGFLMQLFVSGSETEVIAIGRENLQVITLFYWLCGIMYVFLNLFSGMGKMKISTPACCMDPLCRLLFAALLSSCGFGRMGLWMGWPCGWICALLPLLIIWFTRFGKKMKTAENTK